MPSFPRSSRQTRGSHYGLVNQATSAGALPWRTFRAPSSANRIGLSTKLEVAFRSIAGLGVSHDVGLLSQPAPHQLDTRDGLASRQGSGNPDDEAGERGH